MKSLTLFSLLIIFCTPIAFADCSKRSMPEPPMIPLGESATRGQMEKAQKHVKAYVKHGEKYISCMYGSIKYNYALRKIKSVAKNYNYQLRRFKSRNS